MPRVSNFAAALIRMSTPMASRDGACAIITFQRSERRNSLARPSAAACILSSTISTVTTPASPRSAASRPDADDSVKKDCSASSLL
eukprot:scaffold183_cov249-Pinguiococcus_pyrenoidosus.AAC.7